MTLRQSGRVIRLRDLSEHYAHLREVLLLLDGIGAEADDQTLGSDFRVVTKDDIVLANPPFGKKSSVTIVNEAGRTLERIAHHQSRRFLGEHEQVRAALALQLNFLQHILIRDMPVAHPATSRT